MAKFTIKTPIPGIEPDENGVFETEDRPWVKYLRNLPDDQAEEIQPEPEAPVEPPAPDGD